MRLFHCWISATLTHADVPGTVHLRVMKKEFGRLGVFVGLLCGFHDLGKLIKPYLARPRLGEWTPIKRKAKIMRFGRETP